MPENPKPKRTTTLSEWMKGRETFLGFAAPTSNTTYTPNQFFDVCLPHYSRGVVRLVAHLIRSTLGWCDADGKPQEEQIQVAYQELVDRAGISREMIREAINEAAEGAFIECVRRGRPSRPNETAITALYQLRWSSGAEYVKDAERFNGFFEGEGNRTDIPNEFFDWVIPHEPLSVIKVVGSIIRFSIGFQAQHGRRRQQVALSYTDIQNYARIRNRNDLSQALQRALAANYIRCLEAGVFDPHAGTLSKAATYAVKWVDSPAVILTGQKSVPEVFRVDQSEKRAGTSQKNVPENQSEKRTDIEIKQTNKTSKQQQGIVAARAMGLLKGEGFDRRTAERLSNRHTLEVIQNQIEWIQERTPTRNKLGMLRKAIEENWPRPEKLRISEVLKTPGALFTSNYYAGFAGNRGAPIVEPSLREIEAAEQYTKRLLDLHPDPTQASAWGRAFGEMVHAHEGNSRALSLILALRVSGDRFYVRLQRERKASIEREQQTRRETHLQRFEPAWLEYLREIERQFKTERSEDMARFQTTRETKRQQLLSGRWQLNVKERLSRLESELGRLRDFQEFFGLPDFWTWDEKQNPQPLLQ